MLTISIIMVNKTPRDRIASPTYSPPQKLKFMSLIRVTATEREAERGLKSLGRRTFPSVLEGFSITYTNKSGGKRLTLNI